MTTPTVLTNIISDKHLWLQKRKEAEPLASFKAAIKPSNRNFYQALTSNHAVFILECKKASPSKGVIRNDFDPKKIATTYAPYAAAISVLTDEKYFQGDFNYLTVVSESAHQPIICKDFIIDPYQIYLARFYQADAILLMLSVLSDDEYRTLAQVANALNMGILTEVISETEVARAIALGAKVVGINNRNLHDLSIDLNRTKLLAPLLPPDTIIISESGIYNHQTIKNLRPFANGFLIGSALMSEPDLAQAVRKMIFGTHKVCGLTRAEDALAAYNAGAFYGGMIFAEHSPRRINQTIAQALVTIPLNWIGVFVDQPINEIINLAAHLNLHAVQLHGNEDEDDDYIKTLRAELPATCQIWKALEVSDTLPKMDSPHVDYYLLDHGKGGTGKSFDWSLLANQALEKVIIAGGINQNNLAEALQLNAYGLDINSGIESSAGIKDHNKLNTLFNSIRAY